MVYTLTVPIGSNPVSKSAVGSFETSSSPNLKGKTSLVVLECFLQRLKYFRPTTIQNSLRTVL